MRKNAILLLITFLVFVSASYGCGRKNQDNSNDNSTGTADTQDNIEPDPVGTEEVLNTEDTSQLQLGTAVEIPESFEGLTAETDAHEQLEKIIAEYSNVSEADYANVHYYYNYVDLNSDGENEILVLVLGENVAGIDGNMLLWLDETDEENMSVGSIRQTLHQVGTPVYISSHMTEGYRDLIVTDNGNAVDTAEPDVDASNAGRTADGSNTSLQRTAGLDETTGENGVVPISMEQTYILLTWKGDKYQELEEGTALFNLEGYEGTAILTNNIESDSINDNYHFLGEAMR